MFRKLTILMCAQAVWLGVAFAAGTPTIDQTARFLAGLPQLEADSPLKPKEAASGWQKHEKFMTSHWNRLVTRRLGKMQEWSKSDFQSKYDPTRTMLYPFSGPDFVNAHTFYPAAPQYVFFALEKILPLPKYEKMADRDAARALRSVDYALRDIYSKGYFITTHMQSDIEARGKEDVKAQGVVPVFLVFMARTGHEILSVEHLTATPEGALVAKSSLPQGRLDAVRFRFQDRGSTVVQELIYFSVNQHDAGLARRPGYVKFLEQLPPTNTFMKAASYLLFGRTGEGFLKTRALILDKSQTLFQDDTGVPLKHLDSNVWSMELYGKYTKPIADFGSSCFQPDLKKLFEDTPRAQIKHLPFSMGYHVVGDRIQNHMFATKKAAD